MSNRVSSGLLLKLSDVTDDQTGPEAYTLLDSCNVPAVCNGRRNCEPTVLVERRKSWLATQQFQRNGTACIDLISTTDQA